jgi:ribose transport system substrate-binding protein
MKRVAAVLVVVVAALAFAACTDNKTRKLRIAIVPKGLDIPVFNYARTGAERAAAELGNVEVLWRGPERADEVRQKQILQDLIEEEVDGIAISVFDAAYLTPILDKAVDEGIPVVTWDSDAPDSKRMAFYGVDDYKGGETLGDQAARVLGGQGTIAIITSGTATNITKRLEGLRAALSRHPGLRTVETLDIQEDSVRCAELVTAALRRHPDLGAFVSVGGWPVFSRNILAGVDPTRTKVISFDTIPPAPELLKEGRVHVLLGQKYFGWGSESLKLLVDAIRSGRQPASPMMYSGVDVVTAENVDSYLAEWARLERGDR